MINIEDDRWSEMTGGYKTPFDPRPLLKRLETESDTAQIWRELWEELHHQGNVGEASYAAVPFLVASYRKRGGTNWNAFAMAAIIELARTGGKNPDLPQWLSDDYFRAIREFAEIGVTEVLHAKTTEDVRAILSIIAIEKGLRIHADFLLKYSDDELSQMEFKE